MIEEKVVEKHEIATAKIPKQKKKKQPKKLEVKISKVPEIQKLSRPKILKIPKKKTRTLPYLMPVVEKADYAEIEEYETFVTRPTKEVRRQILIESPVEASTVTDLSLDLNLNSDAQPTVTELQLDVDLPIQEKVDESSSDSGSDDSSDESSDEDDSDGSSLVGDSVVINNELKLDIEPAVEVLPLEEDKTIQPVLELNLNVDIMKPEVEAPVKKTKKIKKKVKKTKKKAKDPNQLKTKKKDGLKLDIKTPSLLTESQIDAEVAKKKRRVKRAKPLFDADGNKIVDGAAPTKPKKAPIFKKGISDKIRLMQMRFELGKEQSDPNLSVKSVRNEGEEDDANQNDETKANINGEGEIIQDDIQEEIEEGLEEYEEDQQDESGESEYTYETDTDEEKTDANETAPTENPTTNADTDNLNTTLSSEELNGISGSETETETETEETVTDDSESEGVLKQSTEGDQVEIATTLDLGLGDETPGTLTTLDLGLPIDQDKDQDSKLTVDLQSQILGEGAPKSGIELDIKIGDEKVKTKKDKKEKKDKKKKTGKKKDKKKKRDGDKQGTELVLDLGLGGNEGITEQSGVHMSVGVPQSKTPEKHYREEIVIEVDYESNPFKSPIKVFSEDEIQLEQKAKKAVHRAFGQILKKIGENKTFQ